MTPINMLTSIGERSEEYDPRKITGDTLRLLIAEGIVSSKDKNTSLYPIPEGEPLKHINTSNNM